MCFHPICFVSPPQALAAAAFAESDRLSYGAQVGSSGASSSGVAAATAMLSREAISRLLTEVALSGPSLFLRAFQARLAGHGLRYSQAHSHSIGVALSGGGATASVSVDTSAQMAAFMALIRALQVSRSHTLQPSLSSVSLSSPRSCKQTRLS